MHRVETLASKRKPNVAVSLETALDRVLVGDDPGVRDSDDLGQINVIDPYDGKERAKVVSLRDDPVGRMYKLGQLGKGHDADEARARLKAARHYQRLYERAEIGGARAIDPTKESVDGGRFGMPDTDTRLRAQDKLAGIDREIGSSATGLVRLVLVHKLEIAMLAGDNELGRRQTIRDFQNVLSKIAECEGITGRAGSGRSVRDSHSDIARYADDPVLHRAVHRAKRRKGRR